MPSAVGFVSETRCPHSTNWSTGQKVLTSELYIHKYHYLRVFFVCFFSFAIPLDLIFFASRSRTKLLIIVAYGHIDIVAVGREEHYTFIVKTIIEIVLNINVFFSNPTVRFCFLQKTQIH